MAYPAQTPSGLHARQAANGFSSAVIHSQCFPYELVSRIDGEHFWFRVRNEIILKAISQHLPDWKQSKFLEIGSGAATVLSFLDSFGMTSLEGCDLNPLAISISRNRMPNVTFYECSYEDLVSLGCRNDAVGMFDFIEHLENDHCALSAAFELLKPGGRIFITVPAHQSLYSSVDEMMGHYRRYSKESLTKAVLRAKFEIARVAYIMPSMYPLVALKRRLVNTVIPQAEMV